MEFMLMVRVIGVRFKDSAGAAMKYDGNNSLALANHQNVVSRMHPSTTQGYDLNVYVILSLKTRATVLWQDCSVTTEESTKLVPDINLEDESEVWPGEAVVSQETNSVPGHEWIIQPKKVGIVQSVSANDRLAKVLWLPDAQLQYDNIADVNGFIPAALLPGSTLGLTHHPHNSPELNMPSNAVLEDVTLYDIKAADGLNKRRGDVVILHPPEDIGLNVSNQLDWVGEVVDLGNDGFLTVRLGACQPVKDVRIAPEFATIVYSSDITANDADSGSDYDTEDDGSYGEESDLSDGGQWESLSGQPVSMEDSDADAWSTEMEDEGGDDEAQWSQTVPEFTSPGETEPVENRTELSRREDTSHSAESMEGVETILDQGREVENLSTPDSPLYCRTDLSPPSFSVLETLPPDSSPYLTPPPPALSTQLMKRILKEHRILESSLPDGIFVRSWESRLDLLRVLTIGPLGTPYEFAPFVIDIKIPATYPQEPPIAYFHSWTKGQGPVNPNLYESGKICLSLLGTWHADEKGENWNAARSTILQVLVSILGLVLVKEPYFNEAGFEVRAGLADATVPSALYSERTYFRSRAFITHALTNEIGGVDDVIRWLYANQELGAPRLLDRAIAAAKEVLESGDAVKRGGLSRISRGALVMLKRELMGLEEARSRFVEQK
jgi:ubiquitin-conjugating enzyme E2 O